ncbi:MAG: hypothetical protein Q8N98_05265, partial [bacterium]|nr:hypothetical protein [bacterium]
MAGNEMKRILCVIVALCVYGTILFAQTETNLPLLPSEPIVDYAPLFQAHLICQYPPIHSPSKTHSPPQKQGVVLSVDIPLSPLWDTVREDRIKNRTIQFGGSATPLKSIVEFGGWPVPRIIFAAPDFRAAIEGGIMKTSDASSFRTMEQAHAVLDGAVWYVLVGAEGFFGQEKFPRITKSVNFEADFRRRSYGGQGWLGIKIGDFNRSFIAGRYGRGYARTEGETRFIIPSIDELDWFPLYLEEFRTESFSVEVKAKAKRVSQSVRFNRVEYERMIPSPDPLRFGENRLRDIWLRTETEV